MTLAEWKAQQGFGRNTGSAPNTPMAAADAPQEDTSPLGEMRHATSADDYTSAAEGELLRTGKEAAIGLARSPLDIVKSIAHPLDTLMGIANAVRHPIDTATALIKNPREAGSTLGQLLLAPKVPGAANAALAEGPTAVGRVAGAVGRGAEAVGTSRAMKAAGKLGVLESALRMDPKGIALAAAPYVLEHGGQALQKGGAALEGLDLSLKKPSVLTSEFWKQPDAEVDPAVQAARDRVNGARADMEAGFSRPVASKLNGLGSEAVDISHPPAEVASPGELFPYQRESLQGLRDAAGVKKLAEKFRDNAWANDKSADPRTNPTYPDGSAVPLSTVNEAPDVSDVESTIENAQRAHRQLSPLDELSQLSGRALSEEAAQRLLKRFGGVGS